MSDGMTIQSGYTIPQSVFVIPVSLMPDRISNTLPLSIKLFRRKPLQVHC
jgi:hypothetical protein